MQFLLTRDKNIINKAESKQKNREVLEYIRKVDNGGTSEVAFKLCDKSCFNQHPWMHLNLNTIFVFWKY